MTNQPSLFPDAPPPSRPLVADAFVSVDKAFVEAMPIERPLPVPAKRIADCFTIRLMSAAIENQTAASLTFALEGEFAPPGNRVTVRPTTVVVVVPATVLPGDF